jgi:hypothetical protein
MPEGNNLIFISKKAKREKQKNLPHGEKCPESDSGCISTKARMTKQLSPCQKPRLFCPVELVVQLNGHW